MPRNASGVFSRIAGVFSGPTAWANRRDSGDATIYAVEHDTHDQDVANALTDSISASGLTTPSANLPMGGYRHTGVGNASARTHYGVVGQIQDGGYIWGGTSTGAANAYDIAANISPTINIATPGMKVRFLAHQTNTAGATITVGAGAAGIHIRRMQAQASQLLAGEIQSGQVVEAIYDGTVFRLQNPTNLVTQQVVQGSTWVWGGTSGGSSTAYTISLSPAPTSIPAGTVIRFIAHTTNTGATTSLNVNGLGATGVGYGWPTILDIRPGAIVANQVVEVVYDGLRFQLINPSMGPVTWTPTVTLNNVLVTTSSTTLRARYSADPFTRRCFLEFLHTMQATNVSHLTVSLPVAAYSADGQYTAAYVWTSPQPTLSRVLIDGANLTIAPLNGGSYNAGSTLHTFAVNACYEYA